ncbi:MAG: carbon monoxide dehydrogenase subunit G [Caldilineaceae bacterium]
MQIQGSHTFSAPRQAVWDALLDPTILSMALPGGEQLEKVTDNEYKAAMNVKVGPVQGKFDGKVELSNIAAPDSYRMKVSGQGTPGFLNGEGNVTLSDVEGGTLMSYVGDAQVGGRIAGVGQRLIESTAKSIIKQGLAALDTQIQARIALQPGAAAPETISAAAAAVAPVTPVTASIELPTQASTPSTTEPAPSPSSPASVAAQPTAASAPIPPVAAIPASAPSASSTAARPAAAPPPSINTTKIALEVAKDVSRDLLSDVIPLKNQEKALWFTLGALAMFILVVIIRSVR